MKRKFLLNFSICQLVAHFLRYSVSNFLRWLVVHVFICSLNCLQRTFLYVSRLKLLLAYFGIVLYSTSNFRGMKNYTEYKQFVVNFIQFYHDCDEFHEQL